MKPIEISAEEYRRLAGVPVKQLSGKTGELDGTSEKQVMAEIITALEAKGYRTPREWKPGTRGIYIRVGQLKAKGSGTDEGCPDMIVIPMNTLTPLLIEVKARTKAARLSKEQNTLEQLGVIYVVNSASATLALLERQ